MGFCQTVDKGQLYNLLTGMLGIYILYFIAGILHQSIIKRPHYNRITKNYQICDNSAGMIFVPFFIAWVMGQIYNKIMLKQKTLIPHKNSAITSIAVVAATYFSILAMQKTSFPVVIMFQSCSILPVVFIGVFCSRVHDPNLKLGPKKIIVALIIAAGILVFQFADPQTRQRQLKDQFVGIIFLLFHFVAEGFLPDLQAQIKINFKPQPTEMMSDINKWCAFFAFIICLITLSAWQFVVFMWEHLQFSFDIIMMSIVSGFGQFFIYRMIKQFKQHFVPFTISSRKILTATISIIFYGHKTNWIQIMGISVVLFTVFIQFLLQISKKPKTSDSTKQIAHELHQQKFQQDFKSNQKSLSKQSSQQNNQGSQHNQGTNTTKQKSFRQQNNTYNIKNGISQIITEDNKQNKQYYEEFNINVQNKQENKLLTQSDVQQDNQKQNKLGQKYRKEEISQ